MPARPLAPARQITPLYISLLTIIQEGHLRMLTAHYLHNLDTQLRS